MHQHAKQTQNLTTGSLHKKRIEAIEHKEGVDLLGSLSYAVNWTRHGGTLEGLVWRVGVMW